MPFLGKLISAKIDGFKLLSLSFIIDILNFCNNFMCELRTIPTCIVYANKLFRMPFRTHCTVHIDWFNFHMFRNISLQSKMCIAKVLMKIEPTKIHTSHLSTCTIPVIYICFDRKSINSKPAYEIDIKIIPKYYALTPKINWLLFLRCDFLFTRLINVFFLYK